MEFAGLPGVREGIGNKLSSEIPQREALRPEELPCS